MSTKALFLIALGIVLSGCALSPPTETARVAYDQTMKDVALLIEEQAKTCWERSATVWKDGITIDARMSLHDSALVSAARWSSDIGIQDEFLIIEVKEESDDTSIVVIKEGDYGCGLSGSCTGLNLSADVVRWLDGDLTCGE